MGEFERIVNKKIENTSQMNNSKNGIEAIAKEFNIDLKNISELRIKEKSFFQFMDPVTNELKVLENINSKNLYDQFKNIQDNSGFAKSDDKIANANNIFNYAEKYSKKRLSFMPIEELYILENGKIRLTEKCNLLLSGMKPEKQNEIKYLLQISQALQLKKINLDDAIALDGNNKMIGSTYVASEGKCKADTATVVKYENSNPIVDNGDMEINLDDVDFDKLIDELEAGVDKIEISGEEIKKSDIKKYYEFPELLDRENIQNKRKSILSKLLLVYKNRKMKLQTNENEKENKPKQFVFKKNDGFANELLFALIVGFASGIILTIVLMIIKSNL